MKKIILSFLVFFSALVISFANFNKQSEIKVSQSFPKEHGTKILRVYEDYIINPFEGSKITHNITDGVVDGYFVDNVLFRNSIPRSCGLFSCSSAKPAHPKFNSKGFSTTWKLESQGIRSKIEYLENTYIHEGRGIYKPNQEVSVRKYYEVTYKYDTTAPVCGELTYYNDEKLTQVYNYAGVWLNSEKYYTLTCQEDLTQCYCSSDDSNCINKNGKVLSSPRRIGHKALPTAIFTNNVELTGQCEPAGYKGGKVPELLYDRIFPIGDIEIGGKLLDLNDTNSRIYKIESGKVYDGINTPGEISFAKSGSIDFLAGDVSDISLIMEDFTSQNSSYGVSGIKSYNFSFERLTDRSFQKLGSSQKVPNCSQGNSFSEYNSNGNITNSDKKVVTIKNCSALNIAGEYNMIFEITDWAGNVVSATVVLKIYPNDISTSKSTLSVSSLRDKYANNSDIYTYTLNLKDRYSNPIFDKKINTITQNINGYSGGKTLKTSSNSLALLTQKVSLNTNKNGVYKFTLKSLMPGEYTQRFNIKYNFWDSSYKEISDLRNKNIAIVDNNSFKKPFLAEITVTGPGDKPQVGKLQNYRISLSNPGNVTNISAGKLGITKNTIPFASGHKFEIFGAVDNNFSLLDLNTGFKGQINVLDADSVLDAPNINIDKLSISYRVGGKLVRYILDTFGIVGCDLGTLGLKVIGNIQGDGKSDITGQRENFSDISTSSLRTQIRKNAYELIRGQRSGTIINGVRYVEGDVNISGNINSYETLIVKNGNVFISGDLNSSQSKFGIIVLKDAGYNLSADYANSGNIYIGNNVRNIYGAMYADGALISAKSNGNSYSDSELGGKLDFKGVLFTRNTVGGAVDAGGNLLLPGGGSTNNEKLAKIYDLNYVRKPQLCGVDDYAFKIEYDPSIQINPPKGFGR